MVDVTWYPIPLFTSIEEHLLNGLSAPAVPGGKAHDYDLFVYGPLMRNEKLDMENTKLMRHPRLKDVRILPEQFPEQLEAEVGDKLSP